MEILILVLLVAQVVEIIFMFEFNKSWADLCTEINDGWKQALEENNQHWSDLAETQNKDWARMVRQTNQEWFLNIQAIIEKIEGINGKQ